MKPRISGMLELVCVAALLLLFGVATFTLVSVGADTYGRLLDRRDCTSDMRIASSYLSMKVRQLDQNGAAEVRREPSGDMLVLTSADGDGGIIETRIYLHDGMLCESLSWPEEEHEPELGMEIVPADYFSAGQAGAELSFTLRREDTERSFRIRLRSEAV